jgi:formate hydrogenlyase transcriptional activator
MKPELSNQELSRQRDRLRLLLAVTNAVTSKLDLQELLLAVSDSLRRVVPHEVTGLAIYDGHTLEVKVHALESSFGPEQVFETGQMMPLEGNPIGIAVTTRKPVIRYRLDHEKFPAAKFQEFCNTLGLKSGISVPLLLQDRAVGAITVSSVREAAFNENHAELLQEIAGQLAVAVENAVNFRAAKRESDRSKLLLEINNAVASNLNLHELLQAISTSLRDLVPHDYTGLAIYDEKIGKLRIHRVEATDTPGILDEGETIPMEGTTAGLAFTTRQTVRLDRIDLNEFDAPVFKSMIEALKIQSACVVPLIAHDRAIGIVGLTSRSEAAFSEEDAELLEHIADQLAIAVDNAVNFQRAQWERDRRQLLLEVNNAVVSNLTLHDLLMSISGWLRKFLKHDFASVVLLDEASGQLRIHALDAAVPANFAREGSILPIDGTPAGLAIKTRLTVRRDTVDFEEFYDPMVQVAYKLGVRSGMSVCLISHDKVLGSINLGSTREAAFNQEDQELLEEIAGQIAIAVENALNFEQAERERARAEMLLKVNNAVINHLDLHELLLATSECLREYFKNEGTGLALYDAASNKLRVHAVDVDASWASYFREGFLSDLKETPSGRAFTTRRPVVVKNLNVEEWPSPAVEQAVAAGMRSTCSVPLISHDRALGSVVIGSRREGAFTEAHAEMLNNIAKQLSIAVENALNFEAAKKEKARAETLLEINNAITTHIELPQLVRAISESLRNYFKNDVTGMTLFDSKNNEWRLHALEAITGGDEYLEAGIPTSLDSPAGKAITTRAPVVIDKLDYAEYPSELMKRAIGAGFRSSCNVPLIAHDRVLGAVVLVSRQEAAFTEENAEMLSHIAKQLAIAVENALNYREIELLKNKVVSEKLYLEEEIQTQYNFEEIIGQSSALKKILQQVATVAPTDSVVLLCGETGTGKELIARAIHNLSGRKERTLVKLNCAAIPTGLLESELFGHEKGAFTGAIAQRIGRFELANKGSLLLDEIGEIPLDLQPKLLRVLQEHEFERLGSSRTIKTDARLIAATNVNLPDMVAEKKFRSDLFYRLNVFPITIPPLRDRAGDIPLLVGYFVQKHSLRMNKRIDKIAKEIVDALCEYSWPGNVRELENFIERSVILSGGSELQAPLSELRPQLGSAAGNGAEAAAPASSAPLSLEENERRHILEVLEQTKGVIGGKGGAAEILGLPISTLRNRMKKLGLK